MKLSRLGWILAVFFLVTNIATAIFYINKIENVKTGIALDTVRSIMETTNHTHVIYNFSNNQFEQGLIDSANLSKQTSHIISTYDTLINMLKNKGYSDKSKPISDLTLQMLELQKSGYSNLKSASDFGTDNFKQVANNNFKQAESLSIKIVESLNVYLKNNNEPLMNSSTPQTNVDSSNSSN